MKVGTCNRADDFFECSPLNVNPRPESLFVFSKPSPGGASTFCAGYFRKYTVTSCPYRRRREFDSYLKGPFLISFYDPKNPGATGSNPTRDAVSFILLSLFSSNQKSPILLTSSRHGRHLDVALGDHAYSAARRQASSLARNEVKCSSTILSCSDRALITLFPTPFSPSSYPSPPHHPQGLSADFLPNFPSP